MPESSMTTRRATGLIKTFLCLELVGASLCQPASAQIGKAVRSGYHITCHASVDAPEIFATYEGETPAQRNLGDRRGLSLNVESLIHGTTGKRQMLRGALSNTAGRALRNTEGSTRDAEFFYVWSEQWECTLYNRP